MHARFIQLKSKGIRVGTGKPFRADLFTRVRHNLPPAFAEMFGLVEIVGMLLFKLGHTSLKSLNANQQSLAHFSPGHGHGIGTRRLSGSLRSSHKGTFRVVLAVIDGFEPLGSLFTARERQEKGIRDIRGHHAALFHFILALDLDLS